MSARRQPRARVWGVAGGTLLFGLVAVGVLLGQEGQQEPPEGGGEPSGQEQAEDTVQLVFEREVFTYPAGSRSNPFLPLADGGDAGPRFEQLVFLGAIFSSEPGGSVALLGIRSGEDADETYRLRTGQSLGNTRILEIRPRELVVEVEEFGLTERRTMVLERTAPAASDQDDDTPAEPPSDPPDTLPPPDTGSTRSLDTVGNPGPGEVARDRLGADHATMNRNGGT